MNTVYAPGCALMIYKPQLAERVLSYLNAEWGDVAMHLTCCRHEPGLAKGKLVLAGRTRDENPCGSVILETGTEEDAGRLMESDPAVAEGIMTAELFPYRAALMRGMEG